MYFYIHSSIIFQCLKSQLIMLCSSFCTVKFALCAMLIVLIDMSITANFCTVYSHAHCQLLHAATICTVYVL